MPDELPRDERPKMHEPLQPAIKLKNLVRIGDSAGEDGDEAGKPFAGHVADTLTKRQDKSTVRTKALRRRGIAQWRLPANSAESLAVHFNFAKAVSADTVLRQMRHFRK
jgi:hypothetical protein